jgi:23S rRNA pseudouridine955/2504/2580 synthase
MVAQSKTTAPRQSSNIVAKTPRSGAGAVRHLVITSANDGQRLDNFLLREIKGVPKSHIYQVVRSGQVRVNGGRSKAERRLAVGDEVRVPPLRESRADNSRKPVAPGLSPRIVFEDEHLLVVDKPAGVAAHGGSGVAHGLIERVRSARPDLPFLELGHRLDRETSGLIMLAKTRRCLLALHEQMRSGAIDKRYLTVVIGDWVNDKQHVKAKLVKKALPTGEKRVHVDEEEGAHAHTVFRLKARLDGFSLLEAQLHTGRTHQIRVHLAHLGFVILGDDKYGDFALNREAAKGAHGVRLDRMFLHAWRLCMSHPVLASPLVLEAPLPDVLLAWLNGRDPTGERRARYEVLND